MKKRKKPQFISRETKLKALARMSAGVNVSALARELKLRRKLLYAWRDRFRQGGAEALNSRGRPGKQSGSPGAAVKEAARSDLDRAKQRIAELERKIGQQQVDLDFFRRALRHVQATQRAGAKPGGIASTRSSKR